jgi:hypothetical protein
VRGERSRPFHDLRGLEGSCVIHFDLTSNLADVLKSMSTRNVAGESDLWPIPFF